MGGAVKSLRSRKKSLYLGIAAACVLTLAAAAVGQSPSAFLYFNSPCTLPSGRYESTEPFWIHGGPVYTNGSTGLGAERIEIKIAEGSEFHKVNLTFSNASMEVKNILFRGCIIDVSSGARLTFENCLFDGVTFILGASLPTDIVGESEQWIFERFRGHLALKNSVLNRAQFQVKAIGNPVVGLKMDQCTVHGPDSLLPLFISRPAFLADMKRAQTEMHACVFSRCSYNSTFLAVTRDCVFDACTLIPGLPLPDITSPLQIPAAFHPGETAGQTAAQLAQYVIIPPDPKGSPGTNLRYSISNGELTPNRLPKPLTPRTLASVMPPITPEAGSVANSTGSNPVSSKPDSSSATSKVNVTGVSGTSGAPSISLKLERANVHGLLIMSLGGGEAGSSSPIAAVALKGYSMEPTTVRFNQPVGESMAKALQEVAKFTQLNNGGWPQGYQIELSFADKYSDKDGPSAAVACALLLHSLVTGGEIDPAFAVTGDMNADGSVQPIGGVAAKIRGATKGQCKLIAIPSKNEASLADLLLTDGPAPFASIQIFSIGRFGDAEALAMLLKPKSTQASIAEMSRVQEVLMRNPAHMGTWLRNQHVIAKLQQVLKDSPNHLSAKYLLLYALGKTPQTLSLAGSLSAIDDTGGALIASIKASRGETFDSIGKTSVGSILTRLQALRSRCDGRTRPYADAIINFGTSVKEALDRPAQSYARSEELRSKIRSAASSVVAELDRLLNDPSVREELEK